MLLGVCLWSMLAGDHWVTQTSAVRKASLSCFFHLLPSFPTLRILLYPISSPYPKSPPAFQQCLASHLQHSIACFSSLESLMKPQSLMFWSSMRYYFESALLREEGNFQNSEHLTNSYMTLDTSVLVSSLPMMQTSCRNIVSEFKISGRADDMWRGIDWYIHLYLFYKFSFSDSITANCPRRRQLWMSDVLAWFWAGCLSVVWKVGYSLGLFPLL